MGNRKATLALLAVLTLVFVSFPQIKVDAQAKTIVVPDDYATIQEAIDNANEGDTIFVKSGTYVNQSLDIKKSLSLVGEDPETTIVKGRTDVAFPEVSFVIVFESDGIHISGFTAIAAGQVSGICGSGSRIVIENNTVRNSYNIGIGIDGNNNVITNNNLTGVGAIRCSGSNNTITGNRVAESFEAIELEGSFNIISRNYLTETLGIKINGNSNKINNNILINGGTGIHLNTGSQNLVFENNITGTGFAGILLYQTSNNLVYDNFIAYNIDSINGYGISLSGRYYRAENNTFYRNTLMNNSYNIRIEAPYLTNFWDNGSQGNYWDDYTGTDANEDGLGDIPYIINENNQDDFPLMKPTRIPEFPSWTILPILLVLSFVIIFSKNKFRKKGLE